MMKWSTDKPQVPGWYWFQPAQHLGPIIVCLHMDNTDPESVDGWVVDFAGDERHMESNKLPGEWSGPISLPTDAPEQGCYKAEEVEAIFNGVEVNALAIMALTRIAGFQRELIREAAQRLLDRLRGGA